MPICSRKECHRRFRLNTPFPYPGPLPLPSPLPVLRCFVGYRYFQLLLLYPACGACLVSGLRSLTPALTAGLLCPGFVSLRGTLLRCFVCLVRPRDLKLPC